MRRRAVDTRAAGASWLAPILVVCLSGGIAAQAQVRSVSPARAQAAFERATDQVPPPAPTTALVQVSGVVRTASHETVTLAPLRLRNARTGQIVGTATSDSAGGFSFGSVPPGFYVVEITDRAGHVLATSALISADAGDVIATLVRLPDQFFVGGVLSSAAAAGGGMSVAAGTLAAVTAAATSAGVLAVAATGRPISPEQ